MLMSKKDDPQIKPSAQKAAHFATLIAPVKRKKNVTPRRHRKLAKKKRTKGRVPERMSV